MILGFNLNKLPHIYQNVKYFSASDGYACQPAKRRTIKLRKSVLP
jgi:hypothetical protein